MQTDWSLDGKVAIVTGAAKGGIGGYAHCLATAGGCSSPHRPDRGSPVRSSTSTAASSSALEGVHKVV